MKNRFNEEIEIQTENGEFQPIALVNIDQIRDKGLVFYVPAYQRGYRWRPDEIEVLIDDLLCFMNEEEGKAKNDRCPFYCLQAIVVKNSDNAGKLEVIDGQQRLTTTLILLQALFTAKEYRSMQKDFERNEIKKEEWLEKRLFTINYETRTSSSDWLFEITRAYVADNCNSNKDESSRLKDRNSDYYHFIEAFEKAMEIFTNWEDRTRYLFSSMLNECKHPVNTVLI